MYQPHNAKKSYLYWKIQIISFLDVALHPWRHSMATKGVEGSKSVLKAANDAGGGSLLFCVRKCDQKRLPQVKNHFITYKHFPLPSSQSLSWKCGQRWYKPFIIKIIMSIWGGFESILKIQTRPSPFNGFVISVPSLVVKLNMCVWPRKGFSVIDARTRDQFLSMLFFYSCSPVVSIHLSHCPT